MKNFTLMTFILVALISCGRNDDFIESASKSTSVSSSTVLNPSSNCTFTDVGDDVEMTCDNTVILIPGSRLSSSKVESDKVTIKASRKNGGADGDKSYDLSTTLDSALILELPSTISTTGNAGSGNKLYIKINDDIDCAYTSDAGEFKDPHCFTGATRDPSETLGFTGGTEESDLVIEDVLDIEMKIDLSEGNGVITTATAILAIVP